MDRCYTLFLLSFFFLFFSFSQVGPKPNKVTKVVIDPGHGGKDPGTLGSKSREKDLSLKVSLKVGKYIEENIKNVKVIFTRKEDSSVDLHERCRIANKINADLFISVHANSLPKTASSQKKKEIKGVEIYVMGADNTEKALEVARRENSVILKEKNYEKNYNFNPASEESYILYSMTQSSYQENSLLLAALIDEQMTKRAGRRSYGIKQSNLFVMWNTAMPSVLVEIGYLSNLQEEQELNSERVQSYIASGIYRAVKEYKNIYDSQN